MPEPRIVRIATRESRLAMAQTEMMRDALRARMPALAVEIVGMTTRGDRILDRPLSQVGGKGLFIKELEVALLEDRADIAVHSMKDVPMVVGAEFTLVTFGAREIALDAFISSRYARLEDLPPGAVVGTSSLRRECQLRHRFPRLEFRALRGNVNTRLAKLDAGQYDAIILAVAGLRRLGLADRIRQALPEDLALPAIGQGILAVQFLAARGDIAALLKPLEHRDVALAASAERAVGRIVEGSCEVPVGAYAQVTGDTLELRGFVGAPDGTRLVRQRLSGAASEAEALGVRLGESLLEAGGREILRTLSAARA
jgi:hydroxymethylbilane synthase